MVMSSVPDDPIQPDARCGRSHEWFVFRASLSAHRAVQLEDLFDVPEFAEQTRTRSARSARIASKQVGYTAEFAEQTRTNRASGSPGL